MTRSLLQLFLCAILSLSLATVISGQELDTDATTVSTADLDSTQSSEEPMAAEENQEQELEPIIEDYVMQEGDTLSKLAKLHLGEDAPWDILIKLNTDLPDPNNIDPGTTVKIITGYAPIIEEIEAFQAIIEQVANDVDKNIAQTNWQDASQGDELKPADGVRTLQNSSAILKFDDSSEIQLTEYSQIFLRALETQEDGITRNEIEITEGEAELRLGELDEESEEQLVEINVAGTITRPQRNADGVNATRTRVTEENASQVMVYDGESAVESAGVSVAVPKGMGTIAVAGEAPAEPEALLSAPQPNAIDKDVYPLNVPFSWQAVDKAASYRFEVCKDSRCAKPLAVQKGLTANETTVPQLPIGAAYWRVNAVSQSGLDGFTSKAQIINVIEEPVVEEKGILYYVFLGLCALFALMFLLLMYELYRNRNYL